MHNKNINQLIKYLGLIILIILPFICDLSDILFLTAPLKSFNGSHPAAVQKDAIPLTKYLISGIVIYCYLASIIIYSISCNLYVKPKTNH